MKKLTVILLMTYALFAKDSTIEQFSTLCESSNLEKCADLGSIYEHGLVVKEDKFKQLAPVQKNSFGVKIVQVQPTMFDIYLKACQSGNMSGCNNLGVKYLNGEKTKQNYQQAINYFSKACNGGELNGCNNLAIMYRNAQGVKKNYFKATELYTKSCNGNVMEGCFNLAVHYEKGYGVRQDKLKARELFGVVCDNQRAYGCEEFARLNEVINGF